MSAPGRPKRESLSRSDEGDLIDAPGRPIRECSGCGSGEANRSNESGFPRRGSLSQDGKAGEIGMPHGSTRQSVLRSGKAVR